MYITVTKVVITGAPLSLDDSAPVLGCAARGPFASAEVVETDFLEDCVSVVVEIIDVS